MKNVNEDFVKELAEKYSFFYYKERWQMTLMVPSHKLKYYFLSNAALIAKHHQ